MHCIWKNLLQLLRKDSGLVAMTVELVMTGERFLVLVSHDANLINVLELIFSSQLADVVLDTFVARLNDVARHFNVSVDDETLVRHISVDSNLALVENRVLCDSALPTTQVNVAFKLSRVGSSHNDSLARVAYNWVISGVRVSVKTDNELEVTLFRVRAPLLSHVVASRLREVKTSNGDFPDLSIL